MGTEVYAAKDLLKKYAISLEWKSEVVIDDESGVVKEMKVKKID